MELARDTVKKDGKKLTFLRVKRYLGYAGPEAGTAPAPAPCRNPQTADAVVIVDAGNSFRSNRAAWPAARETAPVIYRMSAPLAQGALWDEMMAAGFHNATVVVDARDVRILNDVHISRALSWERTAKDFVFALQRVGALDPLQKCPRLVVLFNTDGAIICRREDNRHTATLVFDPSRLEGGYREEVGAQMIGTGTALVAAMATHLVGAPDDLVGAVKSGLATSRRVLYAGFRTDLADPTYPMDKIFLGSDDKEEHFYADCQIPLPNNTVEPDRGYWRILEADTAVRSDKVAAELVRTGKSAALRRIPAGKFGHLVTYDRREIEHYGAIRNLIAEYLDTPDPEQPLCFAVF